MTRPKERQKKPTAKRSPTSKPSQRLQPRPNQSEARPVQLWSQPRFLGEQGEANGPRSGGRRSPQQLAQPATWRWDSAVSLPSTYSTKKIRTNGPYIIPRQAKVPTPGLCTWGRLRTFPVNLVVDSEEGAHRRQSGGGTVPEPAGRMGPDWMRRGQTDHPIAPGGCQLGGRGNAFTWDATRRSSMRSPALPFTPWRSS